jgi:catechol 2,3-dioxygenase-like lactoylglutathione lyase family enzyme
VIPVSDVDRAKQFYTKLGWRLDRDFRFVNGLRAVQLTPPSSGCSVHFRTSQGATRNDGFANSAAPGSFKGYLIVSDIVIARNALVARGIEVSDFFHVGENGVSAGLDPERRTYSSRVSLDDPDGNIWILQEITPRLPGVVDPGATSFGSVSDMANALRRAEAAHGEHEKRTGQKDANWPEWYAAYLAAEANERSCRSNQPDRLTRF